MSVSILEVLLSAEINLSGDQLFQKIVGLNQLHNAIVLLEKGYSINDLVEPLLEQVDSVENVPQAGE